MTLEQFVATKTWCDDLGTKLSDARWEGEPNARGWLYLDSLYIEEVQDHWPAESKKRGKWHLLIGRDEQITNDLPVLEKQLWEFAKSEGYFPSVASVTDKNIAEAAAMDDVDRAAKHLQDIAGITTGDVASHHLNEEKWADKTSRTKLLKEWLKAEVLYEE
jgi:diketogulonate reductase-like aldo/keto reductase